MRLPTRSPAVPSPIVFVGAEERNQKGEEVQMGTEDDGFMQTDAHDGAKAPVIVWASIIVMKTDFTKRKRAP